MLKKIICFILSMTMGLALCACGAEQGEISEESTVAETARMQETPKKWLKILQSRQAASFWRLSL